MMKLPVEHERLRLGERREVAVDVLPATLHHRHRGIDEVVHGALQDVGLGRKSASKIITKLALGRAQPVFQRARLESGAIRAVHVLDVQIGDGGSSAPRSRRRQMSCVSSVESSSTWI